jgi:hypothetical protein
MVPERLEESLPLEVVSALNNQPMFHRRRAADMQIFDFGEPVQVVNRRGEDRTLGEYRLHIQGDWRMTRGGTIFVRYEDVLRPPSDNTSAVFDAATATRTLRDELLEEFFAQSSANDRTVKTVDVTAAGGLTITFRGGAILEIDSTSPGSDQEAWRLLLPDGTHAVMSDSGFNLERATPP